MNKEKYDVAIAYRTYPGTKSERNRDIFLSYTSIRSDDKYKLVDLCLKSLKNSLGNLKIKFWAILDGCPLEWEDLFRIHFNENELQIVNLENVGELESAKIAIDILLKQQNSDIVYMAEDDYLYLPSQFDKMIDFLRCDWEVDFVTPYDHLDYYWHSLHDYPSYIKIFVGKHWRTVSSTCNTYLTTKRNLYQVRDFIIRGYERNVPFSQNRFLNKGVISKVLQKLFPKSLDTDDWISLTKINVFNIPKLIKYLIKDIHTFYYYFKAWRNNWKQILFGRRWRLWCPIPSIATHLEERCLAPVIDWEDIIREVDNF